MLHQFSRGPLRRDDLVTAYSFFNRAHISQGVRQQFVSLRQLGSQRCDGLARHRGASDNRWVR